MLREGKKLTGDLGGNGGDDRGGGGDRHPGAAYFLRSAPRSQFTTVITRLPMSAGTKPAIV